MTTVHPSRLRGATYHPPVRRPMAPPPVSYAGEIVAHMRETLASLFSPRVAEQARLIYGGSVNPRNIAKIAAEDGIDGVLTGAASLNAANFTTIVRAFARPG